MTTALLSAALFGISTPLAKLLLGETPPLVLAGLLYLGSGVGLFLMAAAEHIVGKQNQMVCESPLKTSDIPILFVSIVCGNIGTSRTSVYFSAAPFIGAFASFIILRENLTVQMVIATPFMLFGVWLILKEYNAHEHEAFSHEHRHSHDEHYTHEHEKIIAEPHCHDHIHNIAINSHAHVPDFHHYHGHRNNSVVLKATRSQKEPSNEKERNIH